MIAVIQRVSRASVKVDDALVAQIAAGLLVLIGVSPTDDRSDVSTVASKITGLRVFADSDGLMNRSVVEIEGEVLVVSQFTLLGDVKKGRRPSFVGAGAPEMAALLIEELILAIGGEGVRVGHGVFGAHMAVELVNDGPVTLILRTDGGRLI